MTIHLSDPVDRWEWRCPRGHTQWEPTNHHWYCAACAHHADVDSDFDELVSAKTGERLRRDDVVLVTEVGPMEGSRA